MKATVLKNGVKTDYYFDPQHYKECFEAYTQMVNSGEIDSFSITIVRN